MFEFTSALLNAFHLVGQQFHDLFDGDDYVVDEDFVEFLSENPHEKEKVMDALQNADGNNIQIEINNNQIDIISQ